MFANFLNACRCSIQFKLFLSLTVIVALSLTAILASQVYLVQDYFIRQAESNLRSSNYLLSRVLADPLFAHDLVQLQTRLQDIQTKLPICNFQLKDNIGSVVYKVGNVRARADTEFNPDNRDGCYNTILPVMYGDKLMGTVRMGVRTDDIAQARKKLIQESMFFALFWFALFMLPFFVQIRRLIRPLASLNEAAKQFTNGNLEYSSTLLVPGKDEISQLIVSFKGMAETLIRNRKEQAANLAALDNEKSTLFALLSTIPVGVIFADRSHIRYCNNAFRRMCLLSANEDLVGMKNDAMLLRIGQIVADADLFIKLIAEMLETRKLTEPIYFALKDGRTLRLISNVVIAPENNGYLGRFWLFEDVTEEQKILQEAEQHAEVDSLTSIYNRRRFDQDLKRLIAQADRDHSQLALLMFDLDDFKPINDLYGHACGDKVLRQVAQTLLQQLRRNEVLYRIGGDEFAVLLVNASDEEMAIIAERIVHTIHSLEVECSGELANVGCSMGIARYPRDANSIQSLLELADHAMYEAKQQGKNDWVLHHTRK
ncbi:MAG: diguanylate cyclase [Gammaproteobacteria bacterium]|nr:diguanylate cyclase [Gammaproteobacteria bacterium]MBU1480192.1 diguanylate cyclase [Gammaproteobacteria bacterium]